MFSVIGQAEADLKHVRFLPSALRLTFCPPPPPDLYRSLLTDPSRLVRQRALDAFAAFASCTPHAELISAAVSAPAGLQGAVSRHLQRLAGRPRGQTALSEALRRAAASSETAAAVDDVLREAERPVRSDGDPAAGASLTARTMDTEDSVAVSEIAAAPLVNGTGPVQPRVTPENGAGPPLTPRETQLLDGILQRLEDLRQGGGPAADGGRRLRLLTDIQTRLDAG